MAVPKASPPIWQAHSGLYRPHTNAPAGQALGLQRYNDTKKGSSPPLPLISLVKPKRGVRSPHAEERSDLAGPTETQCGPTQKNAVPTETRHGPTQKNAGLPETQFRPTQKNAGPAESRHGPTQKNTGFTETRYGPTQRNAGPGAFPRRRTRVRPKPSVLPCRRTRVPRGLIEAEKKNAMSPVPSVRAAEQLTHLLSWFRLLKSTVSGARFASRIPVAE